MLEKLKGKLTYTQIIVLSFILIIFIGTALLCLPISSRAGTSTPVLNSMFTATSATCVTGLIVYDTYSHWSTFGQCVILGMIQIGGLGFMTIMSMFSVFTKKRIGVYERRLLMQSEGNIRLSGVVKLLRRIIIGTFSFEAAGALLLSFRFCKQMGFKEGLFNAVFHSVSAFCNAGFDLMGKYEHFSSFTKYADDPLVCITLMLLIIIGGLGFLVWSDIINMKFSFKKLSLHSKLVLTTSFILVFGGTLLFMVFEDKESFNGLPMWDKFLRGAFQAVSPRTAGFNTVDLNEISDSSEVLTILLMFIGGSPGSTAGGIKTTTVAVLMLSMVATARHNTHPSIFNRRIPEDALTQATAVFSIYTITVFAAVMVVAALEQSDIATVTFEVISAVGTVGLTRGLTPFVCGTTKAILMFLMFGGRVGGLSVVLMLAEKRQNPPVDRPQEKILVG